MRKIQTHRFAKVLLSVLPLAYGCVAPAQNISVSPKLITFQNQGINTTSAPEYVTLWNNQSGTLTISSIQVSPPFAQTNDCGTSLPTSLPPNGKCTLSITFTPTAKQYYGNNLYKLVINDSAGNSPQIVTLTGNGVIPVTFSPAQIGFPNQAIGTTSSGTIVAMKNNLSVPITVSSVQANPTTPPPPFAVTGCVGTSLAAGGFCNLNVTFSPTVVKYYSGSLTVTDSAPTSPQTLGLGGNGVVPVAVLPKVGGLYFNHQIVNTLSTSQPVTLTNNLSTTLTFSPATTSPFSITPPTTPPPYPPCVGSLGPGASCTVNISFNPQAATPYSANLTITDNAPGPPPVIPLKGMGIAGTPGPTVTVTPSGACIVPSATQQYTANITGTPSTPVNWYVSGVLGGNASVGMITSSGFYRAPLTARTATIKAVTQGSPSYSGSAPVTVTATPSFSIYPFVASIPVGGQQTFQAQVCQVPDSNVSFTVDGIPGGDGAVGTVDDTGVYKAPSTAGKHTVRVTADAALGNKSSGGVVTVFSSITADFGSRANNTAPVPANIFGYGRGESLVSTDQRNLLTEAGVTVSRMSAQIFNVFKSSSTPDWTKIDPMIATVQAAGQHAILQLNQSPTWLQPTTGSCAGNSFAAPTNPDEWVQIAVQYVEHMDAKFPGVVTDYEIWNEPNATGMCTTANHLDTYLTLYGKAAPAMKNVPVHDPIRVGGPVLSGYSQLWLSSLLTNPNTFPYVDFISYHQYFFGSGQLQAQWDTYTGNISLYEATQDASNGAAATYAKVAAQAAIGKQQGGAQTPIYVTEYNDNWAFFDTCCRNDATNAPLFNALYLTDLLNSVYTGSPHVPNNIDYFAGSAYPWFCLIGYHDANSDCLNSVGAPLTPYPQYYAFQLIAGPQSLGFLGLSAGGYMAKSISTPTGGGGLATTAFYTLTPAKDAVVIINPTSTHYSQITVTLANPGLSGTQGSLYQIVNGAQINKMPISFNAQGTSLSTTIDVLPYSVQAVSLP